VNGADGCGGKLRPEVERFAWAMEMKLRKNDHKGGWRDCDFDYLETRIREELAELGMELMRYQIALHSADEVTLAQQLAEKVQLEAADVANFAMMIADNARREFVSWPEDVGLVAEAGK